MCLLDGGQLLYPLYHHHHHPYPYPQWHDASAAILVYDVCNQESLKSTAKWLRRLQDVQPHRRILPILVGTKIDLADSDRRVVTPQDAAALADALKAQHFEACTVCDSLCIRCSLTTPHPVTSNCCPRPPLPSTA